MLAARALVQEPRVLVLDEPTNHLDIRHQIELLSLLRGSGTTVLLVLHELNFAAATCDRLGVLHEGSLVAVGEPRQVLTVELIGGRDQSEAAIAPSRSARESRSGCARTHPRAGRSAPVGSAASSTA